MHKVFQKIIFFLLILSIFGCSTLNFSANYYVPPVHYQNEITELWKNLQKQIPLKYKYSVRIIEGHDSRKLKGIPAMSNNTVWLPNDFIKYIYQNYYRDRLKILTSVIVHEIVHNEFDLPSKPPKEHFKTDVQTIALLGKNQETAIYYYRSLFVVKNYWFARKGVMGHTLNVGWNALNAASYVLGGPAAFIDWFATDLSERMSLIIKYYHLKSHQCFSRSKEE